LLGNNPTQNKSKPYPLLITPYTKKGKKYYLKRGREKGEKREKR
jgi:hypothetical protein